MKPDYYQWSDAGLVIAEYGNRKIVVPINIVARMYWLMRVHGYDSITACTMIGGRICGMFNRMVCAFILKEGGVWVL